MHASAVWGVGTSLFGKQPELPAAGAGPPGRARGARRRRCRRRSMPCSPAPCSAHPAPIQRALQTVRHRRGADRHASRTPAPRARPRSTRPRVTSSAGRYERVLAVGVETMTLHFGGAIHPEATDREGRQGMAMPSIYAMSASRYLHEFGVTPEQLAAVSVKNHRHATGNPRAQHQRVVTVDEVLACRMIADPLTLLQCCSIADAAAAAVVGPAPRRRRRRRAVERAAVGEAVGPPSSPTSGAGRSSTTRRRVAYDAGRRRPRRRRRVRGARRLHHRRDRHHRGARPGRARCRRQAHRVGPHDARRPAAGQPVGRAAVAGPPAGRHRAGPGGRDRVAAARRGRRPPGRRAPGSAWSRRWAAARPASTATGAWWPCWKRPGRVVTRAARSSRSSSTTTCSPPSGSPTPTRSSPSCATTEPVHWSDRYRAWFMLAVDDVCESLRDPALLVRPHPADLRHQAHRRPAARPQADVRHPPALDGVQRPAATTPACAGWSTGRSRRGRSSRCGRGSRRSVDELIDGMLRPQGRADLIRDFAFPIPAVVIAEMLGVPPGDRDLFKVVVRRHHGAGVRRRRACPAAASRPRTEPARAGRLPARPGRASSAPTRPTT